MNILKSVIVFISTPIHPPAEEPLIADPFNKITPISGKTKPYEPEFGVYPLEFKVVYTVPSEPDTN